MIAVLLAASLAAPPSWTPDLADPRQRVLAALVEELSRSQESLRLHGHEAPYFLAYAVRGVTTQEVGAKYGAIFLDNSRRERRLQADVRVGSYEFDNSGPQELLDFDSADSGYNAGREAPLDDDPRALRHAVRPLTDDLDKASFPAARKQK